MRKVISTQKGPSQIGTYSQGIETGSMVYTSGQIALDPETQKLHTESFEAEVRQVLKNVEAILEAGGSSLEDVIKLTVYVTDLANFPVLNEVFKEYFKSDPPARSTVEVCALPMNVSVEIDAIGIIR